MANDIKGITVKIGADTTDLSKAMSSANRSISTTQKQLNEVQKALKLDPSNTELLAQKYRLLTEKADETRKKLQTLKDAQSQVEEQYRNGEIDQGKYDAFRRELITTENQLKELEKDVARSNVTINSFGEKMKETGGKLTAAGKTIMPLSAAVAGIGTAAAVSAVNFERVLKCCNACYVYGLTATSIRKDGHQPIIFMQCGPIRYSADAKMQMTSQTFERLLIPRFTSYRELTDDKAMCRYYKG